MLLVHTGGGPWGYRSIGSRDLAKLFVSTQLKSCSDMGSRLAAPSSTSSRNWIGKAVRATRPQKALQGFLCNLGLLAVSLCKLAEIGSSGYKTGGD